MSVLSGLILEKTYELFVGTNETVRYIRVSVERTNNCLKLLGLVIGSNLRFDERNTTSL